MADELEEEKVVEEGAEAAEGEEGVEGEGGDDLSSGKFTPKRIVLFVVLPLLVFGGVGGAYFMGLFGGMGHVEKIDCTKVEEGDEKFDECVLILASELNEQPGVFLEIPDMIVNLNTSSRQPRFLKISLKIELETAEDQKKFEPLLPRVIDQFQMYLRELRVKDLKGTAGIYRMKIELLNRIGAVTPSVKVKDVLFQEILVQ